jgi:serine/threonine protein kinase
MAWSRIERKGSGLWMLGTEEEVKSFARRGASHLGLLRKGYSTLGILVSMDVARAQSKVKELMGQTVGGWLITGYVAFGKSAILFKAENDGAVGAIKIYDPELVDRFGAHVVEERIRRQLALRGRSHPNLITIIDGGHCNKTGLHYLVMALLEYPNLAAQIAGVPRDRIWAIISQVVEAAKFLEDLGLAHRDIKPDNIAISPDFQHAVLLDLGVLRPVGIGNLTDEEQRIFIGTLQYSSPEFLLRAEEDTIEGWRAVTFYQLGAVLHDMIMKKRIFAELENPYARLVQAVQHDVAVVEAKDVAPELVLLARNCLVKDPKLRLQIVQWEDFHPPDATVSVGLDAKERIRKRRALARQSTNSFQDSDVEQRERNLRRSLDDVQTKLQEAIRRECIGNDLFPPLEFRDYYNDTPGVGDFGVRLCESPEHALEKSLFIWISSALLESQSGIVEISAAACLHDVWPDAKDLTAQRTTRLFRGVFEESVVEVLLRDLIYNALDRAQEGSAGRSPDVAGEQIWLAIEPRPVKES